MNSFLWAALAFASVGVIVAIGMATIANRSAARPDDWGALIPAFVLLCLFGGIAGVLAIVGLLLKLF